MVPDNGGNSRAIVSRGEEEPSTYSYDVWEEPEGVISESIEDLEFYTPKEVNTADDLVSDNESTEDQDNNTESEKDLNSQEDDELFQLHSIEGHRIKGKKPLLLCIWKNGDSSWEKFCDVRQDLPMQTASYVVQCKLKVPFKPLWAKKTVKVINQIHNDINQRRMKTSAPLEMFGIKISRNVQEAYEFDRENGNTLWNDAIQKEMNSLIRMDTFSFSPPGYSLSKEEGWQYAPL